jgi:hypothetical protein
MSHGNGQCGGGCCRHPKQTLKGYNVANTAPPDFRRENYLVFFDNFFLKKNWQHLFLVVKGVVSWICPSSLSLCWAVLNLNIKCKFTHLSTLKNGHAFGNGIGGLCVCWV